MGATPRWMGYVGVDDVDATVDRLKASWRSGVCPADRQQYRPHFGRRRSANRDLGPGRGAESRPAAASPNSDKPGRVGWHELLAADWREGVCLLWRAFRLAEGRTPKSARRTTYQLFSAGGQTIGGMFTKRPTDPVPFWLFYFNVDDIDAAAERVKAAGGRVFEGPARIAGRQLDRPMQATLRAPHSRCRASEARSHRGRRSEVGWSTEWGGFSSRGRWWSQPRRP